MPQYKFVMIEGSLTSGKIKMSEQFENFKKDENIKTENAFIFTEQYRLNYILSTQPQKLIKNQDLFPN